MVTGCGGKQYENNRLKECDITVDDSFDTDRNVKSYRYY